MTGEGSFYFPPQDLLLSWRKATGIISIILVIYRLKFHGDCAALLQLSNNQSFNKHFSMCKVLWQVRLWVHRAQGEEKGWTFSCSRGVHNLPRETSFLHTKRYNTKQQNTACHSIGTGNKNNISSKRRNMSVGCSSQSRCQEVKPELSLM